MRFTIALAAVGAALMVAAAPARADITFFDNQASTFSGGPAAGVQLGGGVQTGAGSFGNVRTYTNGPITITATAISLASGATADRFAAANLGYHGSAGLGVCNAGEGVSCSSPTHQADNAGGKDFILLRFNAEVTINQLLVENFSGDKSQGGTDVEYYLGTIASTEDLVGETVAALTGLGFGPARFDNGAQNTFGGTNTVPTNDTGRYNAVLIGAPIAQSNDFWKLQSVSYTTVPGGSPGAVPEPMSLALLATGLIGLGVAARRRRAAA